MHKPLLKKEFFDKFKVILNLEAFPFKFTSEAYSSKDNDVFIFEEEKQVDIYFQCPDYKSKLIPIKRNYIYKLPKNSPKSVFHTKVNSKDGWMYKVKLDVLIKIFENPYDISKLAAVYKHIDDYSKLDKSKILTDTTQCDNSIGCLTAGTSTDTTLIPAFEIKCENEGKMAFNNECVAAGIEPNDTVETIINKVKEWNKLTVEELLEKHGGFSLSAGEEMVVKEQKTVEHLNNLGIDFIESPKSILLEAESIVNGERNTQYGDAKEAFQVYVGICKSAFGLDLSSADVAKVMIAIKLGRERFKHKRDNLVDLTGYTEILNRLLD